MGQRLDLLHELTPSDQDGLINDHFVGWVEVRNPTATRLAVIELGFAKLNPTYGTTQCLSVFSVDQGSGSGIWDEVLD
ncbi:MAG: hypothetical protein BJG00_009300 [Limnothrix sp. CACIAM 69d]|nr:MAG: hypothetical protein BJG00_009300 [Limnothrix sp. CACIAM 69d]